DPGCPAGHEVRRRGRPRRVRRARGQHSGLVHHEVGVRQEHPEIPPRAPVHLHGRPAAQELRTGAGLTDPRGPPSPRAPPPAPRMLGQLLIDGVAIGAIYALAAIGFVLIFRTIDTFNFFHGEMYMVGAFLGFTAVETLRWPVWVGLPVAVVAAGLTSALL